MSSISDQQRRTYETLFVAILDFGEEFKRGDHYRMGMQTACYVEKDRGRAAIRRRTKDIAEEMDILIRRSYSACIQEYRREQQTIKMNYIDPRIRLENCAVGSLLYRSSLCTEGERYVARKPSQ